MVDDAEKQQATTRIFGHESPQIVAWWPGGSVTIARPEKGRLVIGRTAECGLTIPHPSVSRQHAAIDFGTSLRFEDLGSANGSRVDGKSLASREAVALTSRSIIEVGAALVSLRGNSGDEHVSRSRAANDERVVARDPEMVRLLDLLSTVAESDLSVLLLGETGSGKEVLANEVHARSPRAHRPMVTLNCAAVPESLLESELFGFEKGAFTGATQAKMGLLESAHESTLFLDEIGDMPLQTQVKLLRVIENRQVTRLGSLSPKNLSVRFISATHKDLTESIWSGNFREDLYYRLNGISLRIPPLRERPVDIAPLAERFLDQVVSRARRSLRFADDAMAALQGWSWPGNVRELKNVVERAAVLARSGDLVEREHIRFDTVSSGTALPPADLRTESGERAKIRAALEACAGNQRRAAELLGISRRTLVSRLAQYQLPRPKKSS